MIYINSAYKIMQRISYILCAYMFNFGVGPLADNPELGLS